jgi:Domain of unknown function (DUF4262)
MCWLCENADAQWPDYLDHMRDTIRNCGWAVQAVERYRVRPPWAYTVGLTAAGLPELVVTGVPARRAAELLNDVAAHVAHGGAPAPGEQFVLEEGPPIEIVELTEPAAHLFVATELYGKGISALQLVHADDRGHWPWDVGYRGVRGGQPVLGTRATREVSAA